MHRERPPQYLDARTLRSHLSSSLSLSLFSSLLFFSFFPPARPSGRPLLLDAFSFLLFFFSFRSRPPSLLVSLLSPLCAEGRDFFSSIGHVGARAFHFFPFAVNFLCAGPRFCPAAPLPLNSSFGDISSCLSAVMAATSSASLFRREPDPFQPLPYVASFPRRALYHRFDSGL